MSQYLRKFWTLSGGGVGRSVLEPHSHIPHSEILITDVSLLEWGTRLTTQSKWSAQEVTVHITSTFWSWEQFIMLVNASFTHTGSLSQFNAGQQSSNIFYQLTGQSKIPILMHIVTKAMGLMHHPSDRLLRFLSPRLPEYSCRLPKHMLSLGP